MQQILLLAAIFALILATSHTFFTKVPVGSLVDCLFLTFLQQNSYCFAVISYFQTVMGLLVVSIRPYTVNSNLLVLYLQQILEMAAILTSLFQNFVQFLTFLQQNSYCFAVISYFQTVMSLLVVSIRTLAVISTLYLLNLQRIPEFGCSFELIFQNSGWFLTFLQQNSYCFAVISYLQTVMGLLVVSIRPLAANSVLYLLNLRRILGIAGVAILRSFNSS